MTDQLVAPPVLSTPDTHIFEDPTPPLLIPRAQRLNDQALQHVYEIDRTAKEISEGGWKRIALQFPDGMLHDAPRIFEALQIALKDLPKQNNPKSIDGHPENIDLTAGLQELDIARVESAKQNNAPERLFILADTSYGACCVDEIAAEHVDADVVVHYGRSCLSPTARLPVIYVYTTQLLQIQPVIDAFEKTYKEKDSKIILMADITFQDHISEILRQVKTLGYSNVYAPSIIHNPSSPIPNRTIPPAVEAGGENLNEYHLFHISDPPASLLLILSSRLQSMHIYPTTNSTSPNSQVLEAQSSRQLSRRYALLTSLTTCSIFGILINTLSVKNYLDTVTTIQSQIAAAGKKSYTFVVGKVNAAKVANFSEIGGWVVIGCWESSLLESTEFFRPIITPFELNLALQSDEERVWTGEWIGDISSSLKKSNTETLPKAIADGTQNESSPSEDADFDDEEDSAPPEYDLRTGRYVSHSRPMRNTATAKSQSTESSDNKSNTTSSALLKRANGDVAMINGIASPGAEYLRSQRTWTGLGSDFEIAYENEDEDTSGGAAGALIEQGRSGVARGYTVGREVEKR